MNKFFQTTTPAYTRRLAMREGFDCDAPGAFAVPVCNIGVDVGVSASSSSSTGAQQASGNKFVGIGGSVGLSTSTVLIIVGGALLVFWFVTKKK